MLRAIAGAEPIDGNTPFATAWNRLVAASGAMDADAAMQEYTDLFIGVGRCEVNLHGSHWIAGAMLERPLAELRGDLKQMGLARREEVVMLEDHLSALFETMRLLIAGNDERAAGAGCDAAGVFRAPRRAVGVSLLQCNTRIDACKLLCVA